jgi:hypothetical protein
VTPKSGRRDGAKIKQTVRKLVVAVKIASLKGYLAQFFGL